MITSAQQDRRGNCSCLEQWTTVSYRQRKNTPISEQKKISNTSPPPFFFPKKLLNNKLFHSNYQNTVVTAVQKPLLFFFFAIKFHKKKHLLLHFKWKWAASNWPPSHLSFPATLTFLFLFPFIKIIHRNYKLMKQWWTSTSITLRILKCALFGFFSEKLTH